MPFERGQYANDSYYDDDDDDYYYAPPEEPESRRLHPRRLLRLTTTARATTELSRALRAAAVAAPVYLLASVIPPGGLFRERRFRDVGLYGDYAQSLLDGRVPYRDFFVEYPPGGFLVFTPPALLPDGWYLHAFKVLMAVVGLATLVVVGLILARLGASTRRLYAAVLAVAAAPLVVGPVSLNTYDAFPALLVAASLAALLWRRDSVAFALLGVAFAAKLYAAALVPLFAVWLWRTGRPLARPLVAFAVAALVLVGPFALLGWDGLVESVRAQAGRGLQIESLGAAVLLAAHRLGVYDAEVVRGSTAALTRDLDGALPDALAFATVRRADCCGGPGAAAVPPCPPERGAADRGDRGDPGRLSRLRPVRLAAVPRLARSDRAARRRRGRRGGDSASRRGAPGRPAVVLRLPRGLRPGGSRLARRRSRPAARRALRAFSSRTMIPSSSKTFDQEPERSSSASGYRGRGGIRAPVEIGGAPQVDRDPLRVGDDREAVDPAALRQVAAEAVRA